MEITKEQIKTKSTFDIIEFYLNRNYLNKNIVVIFCNVIYDWVIKNLPAIDENSEGESLVNDYIFIEFEDIEDAIGFCNSVPDSNPYACVWEKDQIVHENT